MRITNLSNQPAYSYQKEKQTSKTRIKLTRRQRSEATPKVREEVKKRSNGVCECCDSARSAQLAHIERRWKSEARPTKEDFVDLCDPCHDWADETDKGREWLEEQGRRLRQGLPVVRIRRKARG